MKIITHRSFLLLCDSELGLGSLNAVHPGSRHSAFLASCLHYAMVPYPVWHRRVPSLCTINKKRRSAERIDTQELGACRREYIGGCVSDPEDHLETVFEHLGG